MLCQRDLCQQVVDGGGHYFFEVKDNQPELKESIAAEFEPAFPPYSEKQRLALLSRAETLNKGHGPRERRCLEASTRLAEHLDWPGVAQVCRLGDGTH